MNSLMLVSMKKAVSQSLPPLVRNWIWCLTDAEYRKEYRANQQRIANLRAAQNEAGKYILSHYGSIVLDGPFRGLNYLVENNTVPTHKLLGTYEKELWPIIEEIIARDYRTIIDIGAAEGYYVVGLAQRMPEARVVAFEAQLKIHPRIRRVGESKRCPKSHRDSWALRFI